MPQNKKSKQDIEKLHKILDNPSDPQMKTILNEDDKALDSLRRRMTGETKPSVSVKPVTKAKQSQPLAPTVTIHKKIDIKPSVQEIKPFEQKVRKLPEFTEVRVQESVIDPFADENLYEVEKITFLPPTIPQEKPPIQPQDFQEITSIPYKTTNQLSKEEIQLPEWQPLEEQEPSPIVKREPTESPLVPQKPSLQPSYKELQEESVISKKKQTEMVTKKQIKQLQREQKREAKKAKKLAAQQAKLEARQKKERERLEAERHKQELKKAQQKLKQKEASISQLQEKKSSRKKQLEETTVFEEYHQDEIIPEGPVQQTPVEKQVDQKEILRQKKQEEKKAKKLAAQQAKLAKKQQKQQAKLESQRRKEEMKKAREKQEEKKKTVQSRVSKPSKQKKPEKETIFEEYYKDEIPPVSTIPPLHSTEKKETPLSKREQIKEEKKKMKLAEKETKRIEQEKKEKKVIPKIKHGSLVKKGTTPPVDQQQIQRAHAAFQGYKSIDEKTAVLLYNHGYFSVDDLKKATLNDLTIIRGIKRKHAKQIKKEIEQKLSSQDQAGPSKIQKHTPLKKEDEVSEWKAYDVDEIPLLESVSDVCTSGAYTLYKREVVRVGGKKTTIHFFSKERPPFGEPASLPSGYSVAINRKTSIPYLKKKR